MGLMNSWCGFDQADYYKLLDVDDFASVKDIKGHILSLCFFSALGWYLGHISNPKGKGTSTQKCRMGGYSMFV